MSERTGPSVETVFEEILEVPGPDRDRWLADRPDIDEGVREEVRSLLRHDRQAGAKAGAFLPSPVRRGPADGRVVELGILESEPRFEDDPGAAEQPEFIGPFRVTGLIGRGGMGAVYEAEQDRPRRTVAVKVIRSDLAGPSTRRRFAHEAEVLARLDHAGIARIFAAGVGPVVFGDRTIEQAYIAMERVHGERLDAWAERSEPGVRETLELIAGIADALHHAHQKGVVHRDLKPANVLVTPDGGPCLLDFGVALTVDADTRITTLRSGGGAVVGTLAYMSPEQIAGDPDAVDVRSDVYALGVVAYELLTGRLPHETANRSPLEIARSIREDDPQRPSKVERALGGDVETIVMTAIAKDPARRYASASEFAADIRRWIAAEPIAARPASTLYQLHCFARRNTGLVAGFGAATVLLIAGTITSTAFAFRAHAAEAAAIDDQAAAIAGRAAAVAEAERAWVVGEFLERILASADPLDSSSLGPEMTVVELLDRASTWIDEAFVDSPIAEAESRTILGRTEKNLGRFDAAADHLERAVSLLDGRDVPDPTLRAAVLAECLASQFRADRRSAAEGTYEQLKALVATIGDEPLVESGAQFGRPVTPEGHRRRLAGAFGTMGWFEHRTDRGDAAVESMERGIELALDGGPSARAMAAAGLSNLAGLRAARGEFDAAAEGYDDALAIVREILPPDHGISATIAANVGALALRQERWELAADRFRESVDVMARSLGPVHDARARMLSNLGYALHELARWDEGDAVFRESLAITAELQGEDHREYAGTLRNHAFLLKDAGRHAEAADAWQRVRDFFGAEPDPPPGRDELYRIFVAEGLAGSGGDWEEQRSIIESAWAHLDAVVAEGHHWRGWAIDSWRRAATLADDEASLARLDAVAAR